MNERRAAYVELSRQRAGLLACLDRRGWRWDREVSLMLDRLDSMLQRRGDNA